MNALTVLLLFGFVSTAVAVVYPYLIYPALLRILPRNPFGRRCSDAVPDALPPRAALLFCAHNEARSLPDKLDNLRAVRQAMPELEILAYDDASDDATGQLLAGAPDLLRVVTGEVRMGKITGMRCLVDATSAEILIFTDANVIVDPESLPRLLDYFSDPEVGAVSGTLLYTDDGIEHAVARVGGLYWRIEERIKSLESGIASMMGADGSLFARRRAGYPVIPTHLADDMAVSMDVVFQGLRCVSAPDVLAYERAVSQSAEEFRRKRRVSCGSYGTHLHYKAELAAMPPLERFMWFSHRVVRWWGGVLLALSAAFLIAASARLGFGIELLALIFVGPSVLVAGASLGLPGVSAIQEMLLGIVAAQIGVLEALAGRTYATWIPATSR